MAIGICNMITPTEHEKREWSRCAQAMYDRGRNDLGHKMSMSSAMCGIGQMIPYGRFRDLQEIYRAWLVFDEPKG